MTYYPGGGSGSSSVSTASDVALNNPLTGDVLTYDGGLSKWINQAIPAGGALDDRVAILATADRFAGIDATGATSSTAGLQAFFDAIPDGGLGIIPRGTYRFDGRVNCIGKSFTIEARGATFVQNSHQACFQMINSLGTAFSVSSVTASTVSGHNGEVVPTTTLELTAAPDWTRNDIVKIASDNAAPDTTALSGQFLRVLSVSSMTVIVDGRLRDTYVTNIRAAKVPQHRARFIGGTYRASDAMLDGTTASDVGHLNFEGMIRPTIKDIQVAASAGPGVTFRGCLGYVAEDLRVDWAQDEGTKYGYGINDAGSEYGRVTRLHARRVRHAYSCNSGGAGVGSATLTRYGRTFGAIVSEGVVSGSSQSAYDTHGDGDSISFINCQAISCYAGFGLRGRNHQVRGGLILGGGDGVVVFGNNAHGDVIGGGLVINGNTGSPIWFNINNGGVKEVRPSIVDGLYVVNRNGSKAVIAATNATVWVGTVGVAAGGTTVSRTNSDVITMPTLSLA